MDAQRHTPSPHRRPIQEATVAMLTHRRWVWRPLPRTDDNNEDHDDDGAADADFVAAFGFLAQRTDSDEDHWGYVCHPGNHNNNTAVVVVVVITEAPKLGMVHLRQAYAAMQRLRVDHLEFVSRHANLLTASQSQSTVSVVPWLVVMMYPLDHELVPLHRKATPEERRALHPLTLLPVLRADDIVARYLGLRVGDVVRIDRCDGTVYWRHIVGTNVNNPAVSVSVGQC